MNNNQLQKELIEVFEIGLKAKGKTLRQLIENTNHEVRYFDNKDKIKHIIQQTVFNIPLFSKMNHTFEDLEMELKTLSLKKDFFGELTVKENMSLNDIYYDELVNETFQTSKFIEKNQLLLIVTYVNYFEKDFLDYVIEDCFIVDISQQQEFLLIVNDWRKLQDKVKKGYAEDLNFVDTTILGVTNKSQSKIDLKNQPFSNILARFRSFAFKTSFLESLRNKYDNKIEYINEMFSENEIIDLKGFEKGQISSILNEITGKSVEFDPFLNVKETEKSFRDLIKNENSELAKFLEIAPFRFCFNSIENGEDYEAIKINYEFDPIEVFKEDFEQSFFYQSILQKLTYFVEIDSVNKLIKEIREIQFDEEEIKKFNIFYTNIKKEVESFINEGKTSKLDFKFKKRKENFVIELVKDKNIKTYNYNNLEFKMPKFEYVVFLKKEF